MGAFSYVDAIAQSLNMLYLTSFNKAKDFLNN